MRSCDSCSDRLIDTRKAVAPIPTEGDPDDHFLCRSGSLDTWVLNLRTSDKEQLDSGRDAMTLREAGRPSTEKAWSDLPCVTKPLKYKVGSVTIFTAITS